MALPWTRGALDDLDRIAMFNEQYGEARATYVNWRIVSQAAWLPAAPRRGRPVGGSLRDLSIGEIQYVITYSVAEPDVTIPGVGSTREGRRPS